MKNKKIAVSQVIRHVVQAVMLMAFPGLFIMILGAVKSIYVSLISGAFSWSGQLNSILVLLAVIPVTIFAGRFFCGWLCAFGAMQELLSFVGKKLKIPQVKLTARADRIIKWGKYIVLAVAVVLWTLKISVDTFSPWYVFGVYSSYKAWKTFSYMLSFGGALLTLIIIASLFSERFFCKYFCPVGGILGAFSKARFFRVKKNKAVCTSCGLCNAACPMSIDVNGETSLHGKVSSGECINCFKCTSKCARSCLYTNTKEVITGTAAAAAIAGLYFAGTIPRPEHSETAQINIEQQEGTVFGNVEKILAVETTTTTSYKDGTYTGSGQGFRGTTKVSVTVSGGKITAIEIVSYDDDEQFFRSAKTKIISEIIKNQSTEVSTVSGATFSSNGIIEAVANALNIEYTNPNSTAQNGHGKKNRINGEMPQRDSDSEEGGPSFNKKGNRNLEKPQRQENPERPDGERPMKQKSRDQFGESKTI